MTTPEQVAAFKGHVKWLQARYKHLHNHPLFKGMFCSEDPAE